MPVKGLISRLRTAILLSVLCAVARTCLSCRTVPPPPPIDLSAPGWRIQRGQAVWEAVSGRPEIAGDLLLATRTNGEFYIQFTKAPFTLVDGSFADGHWHIEYTVGQYSWSGRGTPPARFAWFELPRVLDGEEPRRGWRFTRTNDLWRLERRLGGEWLEGRFFQ